MTDGSHKQRAKRPVTAFPILISSRAPRRHRPTVLGEIATTFGHYHAGARATTLYYQSTWSVDRLVLYRTGTQAPVQVHNDDSQRREIFVTNVRAGELGSSTSGLASESAERLPELGMLHIVQVWVVGVKNDGEVKCRRAAFPSGRATRTHTELHLHEFYRISAKDD
ncbi:hypothetical protein PLICRDRAFT_123138, partial [Plicaturopsis crispa FD-325 SS-3]